MLILGQGPTWLSLRPDHTPTSTSVRASEYCCRPRIDRLLYHDASSIKQPTAAETQQPPPSIIESNQAQQNLLTRKEIYMNVTGFHTKSTNKPRPVPRARSSRPPAVPPKTYKKLSDVQIKESCPPGSKPRARQQHTSAERNVKQESQLIVPGGYKNVPQQEMIGKVKLLTSINSFHCYLNVCRNISCSE